MPLRDDQVERYSRQMMLPIVGSKGQERLLSARVLIIGVGGLGSPCAIYLAAAGVGKIGVVDSETVELSNLHRQILYSTRDVGRSKVESAKERLNGINPDVEIVGHKLRLSSENILDVIKDYDAIVDASDNFPTRYLANDACVILKKPLFHGSIFGYTGQAITILPWQSPCYRCLFPEPPPSKLLPSVQEEGILGVVPGVIGIIQANEVLRYILLGADDLLLSRLLVFDALNSSFREVKVKRNPECLICGKNPTITELQDYYYKEFS